MVFLLRAISKALVTIWVGILPQRASGSDNIQLSSIPTTRFAGRLGLNYHLAIEAIIAPCRTNTVSLATICVTFLVDYGGPRRPVLSETRSAWTPSHAVNARGVKSSNILVYTGTIPSYNTRFILSRYRHIYSLYHGCYASSAARQHRQTAL